MIATATAQVQAAYDYVEQNGGVWPDTRDDFATAVSAVYDISRGEAHSLATFEEPIIRELDAIYERACDGWELEQTVEAYLTVFNNWQT